MVDLNETISKIPEKLRFERSITLGSVLTMLGGVLTAFFAYNSIISKLDHIERSALKSDVMWEHFMREHNDISSDDLRSIR